MINTGISKIRLHLKHTFDRLNNEQLKKNVLQAIPFWIASILTGLIAVLYTRLFVEAENVTTYIFKHYVWLLFIVSPVCFIIAWWLVKRFAPYSKGSGIPQVMAAIEISAPNNETTVNKLLSIRIIV
jgi:H+/Cl- antiporter ClcA